MSRRVILFYGLTFEFLYDAQTLLESRSSAIQQGLLWYSLSQEESSVPLQTFLSEIASCSIASRVESSQKLIYFYQCTDQEVLELMPSFKGFLDDRRSVAFARSTPHNIEWTMHQLAQDVWQDHRYLLENPPNLKKI